MLPLVYSLGPRFWVVARDRRAHVLTAAARRKPFCYASMASPPRRDRHPGAGRRARMCTRATIHHKLWLAVARAPSCSCHAIDGRRTGSIDRAIARHVVMPDRCMHGHGGVDRYSCSCTVGPTTDYPFRPLAIDMLNSSVVLECWLHGRWGPSSRLTGKGNEIFADVSKHNAGRPLFRLKVRFGLLGHELVRY
jgi:hypothetical protein